MSSSVQYAVVVPAYNAEKTIADCLRSVAAQTLKPAWVIVVDDFSSDDTGAAARNCSSFLAEADIGFDYVRLDRNVGPSAARNAGIRKTTQRYIAFLDADDTWACDKLAAVNAVVAASSPGLVCHSYTDSSKPALIAARRKSETLSLHQMLLRNPAQTSCAVIRSDLGFEFDESMRYCEDHDLWMRIAETASVLRIIGDPLTCLGRPQLSAGGLSEDTLRMRIGEIRVYYNFCGRAWARRFWFLPGLVLFSVAKHAYSWVRRRRLRRVF